ncbi:MAG: right-handed parallel beta-helix repeat-containing protein, partial [Chloroflexota bacterium]|nr:right-handed parallel beta-helix repeat-containing protein [Chloroflexota bacterium]
LYNRGETTSTNTIIAGNTLLSPYGDLSQNCYNEGTFTSLGATLLGNAGTCPSNGSGDLVVDNATVFATLLGELADNGGPTLTHALLPGSVAIDTADEAGCADEAVDSVDQRGIARPQGPRCDIGAYEDAPLCDFIASDEASLERAIRCANGDRPGIYTIQITADITLTQPSTALSNPQAAQIVIEGNGHTLNANGHGRVLTLKLTQVVIRGLTLRGGRLPLDGERDDSGGGILLAASFRDGGCGLTLLDSIVEDNEAPNGGGIANLCDSSMITITNSIVRNNHARLGGGIYIPTAEELFSELVMQNSQVINNRAEEQGGGIFLRAGDSGTNATISDSTIADNSVVNGAGGGISVRTGNEAALTNLMLQRVAITGNTATTGGGLHVESRGSTVVAVGNTTISSNQAVGGSGGGVFIKGSTEFDSTDVRLINTTIANNAATAGGGIYKLDGLLTIANTLVAANTTGDDCQLDVSPGLPSRYVSNGHNLDSDGTCLTPEVRQPSDLPNANANLGPLANHGGQTLTHALLPGSDAIDAGDDAVCAADPVNGVDQRGVARPQGAHCDIGAYESAPAEPTGNLIFVSSRHSGRAGEVAFRDEDIVAYDASDDSWLMIFDGSDVGVTKDVDAFSFLADGSLLLSFNGATQVTGLGEVDDSDIVRFVPTQLGNDTAGSFAPYLRGADVGLTSNSEDIDVIDFSAEGNLIVSTIGDFDAPTAAGQDEDLWALDNATFGNPSSGTWRLFFDGASVGLANEDIYSLWIDPTTGELYLTVKDSFAFGEEDVDANDIFVCVPSETNGCTYRRFWDADQHDYSAENLDGIDIGALPPTLIATLQASTQAQGADGAAFEDMDSDDLDEADNKSIYLPLINRK